MVVVNFKLDDKCCYKNLRPLWGPSPRPYAFKAHALRTELQRQAGAVGSGAMRSFFVSISHEQQKLLCPLPKSAGAFCCALCLRINADEKLLTFWKQGGGATRKRQEQADAASEPGSQLRLQAQPASVMSGLTPPGS